MKSLLLNAIASAQNGHNHLEKKAKKWHFAVPKFPFN